MNFDMSLKHLYEIQEYRDFVWLDSFVLDESWFSKIKDAVAKKIHLGKEKTLDTLDKVEKNIGLKSTKTRYHDLKSRDEYSAKLIEDRIAAFTTNVLTPVLPKLNRIMDVDCEWGEMYRTMTKDSIIHFDGMQILDTSVQIWWYLQSTSKEKQLGCAVMVTNIKKPIRNGEDKYSMEVCAFRAYPRDHEKNISRQDYLKKTFKSTTSLKALFSDIVKWIPAAVDHLTDVDKDL